MALFAVTVAQKQDIDLSVEDAISSTYDQWSSFEEIDALFKVFLREKRAGLEGDIAIIAGPKNSKNIRLARSLGEVETFKDSLRVEVGNREDRRGLSRRARQRVVDSGLPDAEAINRAASQETERQPLKIMVAKSTGDGFSRLSDVELDEVVDTFSISDVSGKGSLRADVIKMVTHLQREPISPATLLMKHRSITLQGAAKGETIKLPLRRFAPEDCPNLGVHGANRYQRVVFAIHDGALILVKVQSHKEFDRSYRWGA
jgi:hypothetical protein